MVVEAERLGFDSVWTAEAYGSDAITPLAWWGSRTERIRLGTAVAQISARTPTATAMAAQTIDRLSGGRFVLGLGVSGPQVVEGWYGQPYARPLARTREYVDIVRSVLRGERVEYPGVHYAIPYRGSDATGHAKSLRSIVGPTSARVPVFLGAEGPRNIALAAEIADGWLPLFFSPRADDYYRRALEEGFSRAPDGDARARRFEVAANVPVVVGQDVEVCADALRPMLALYIGGMGARGANFHFDVFARLGFEEACERIQTAYLDGRRSEAIAAVPTELVTDVALIGSTERIRDEADRWRESVATMLLVSGSPAELNQIAGAMGW